jgi:hypothetical protein
VGATVTTPTCAGGGTNALAGAFSQALGPMSNASANAVQRVGELGMRREAEERRRMSRSVVYRRNVTGTARLEEEHRRDCASAGFASSPAGLM